MKQVISTLLLIVFLISVSAVAEEPDSILFRGIEWFKEESVVKPEIDGIEGIKPSWYKGEEENARIDSWYRQWENMYADVNLENGGVILRYENVSVAGYNCDLKLSFAYAITDDRVSYDMKSAEFYKAEYTIEELEDMEGAYNDLVDKLSQLYGSSEDKSYLNSFDDMTSPKGSIWTAKDGSLVWVGIYYNSFSEVYDTLKIVYAAPDVDGYLTSLDDRIKKETAEGEAIQREENASNFEGL